MLGGRGFNGCELSLSLNTIGVFSVCAHLFSFLLPSFPPSFLPSSLPPFPPSLPPLPSLPFPSLPFPSPPFLPSFLPFLPSLPSLPPSLPPFLPSFLPSFSSIFISFMFVPYFRNFLSYCNPLFSLFVLVFFDSFNDFSVKGTSRINDCLSNSLSHTCCLPDTISQRDVSRWQYIGASDFRQTHNEWQWLEWLTEQPKLTLDTSTLCTHITTC